MEYNTSSIVEDYFFSRDLQSIDNEGLRNIPVVIVDNYIELGQVTALRFLEWVVLNPGGVIALPTGKTPEFFIKWTEYYLNNWEKEATNGLLSKLGFSSDNRPKMKSLHFFQLDEFFPINPEHERSFTYFVKKFYIEKLGLDYAKANLINTYNLLEDQKKQLGYNINNIYEVFPEGIIDLSLRIRKSGNEKEKLQKQVIRLYDQFCSEYEDKIRRLGGIGFFLGGIGPDGHIAFNVKGSDHHSTTRLTDINYQTQAAAASDLGGIEKVREKSVITIGLGTITYNHDAVAIIIAAGESKSGIIANAVEKTPDVKYPATCLQKLTNSRFFITKSASKLLRKSGESTFLLRDNNLLSDNYLDDLIIKQLLKDGNSIYDLINKYDESYFDTEEWEIIKSLAQRPIKEVLKSICDKINSKIEKGLQPIENNRILHTGPHHDDIELGYFPYLHHIVRSVKNENHFVYCTSGFTSVTSQYVKECLENVLKLLKNNKHEIENLRHSNFANEDITGYLNGIAEQNAEKQYLHLSFRLIRLFFQYLSTSDISEVIEFTKDNLERIKNHVPGRKEPKIIQNIKGWLREFEAELVWAHFGIGMENVYHLRLQFYSDDIFPRYPDYNLDVQPIFELLDKIKPTIITLALDPEGSGPDTHYKTLMALYEAIKLYHKRYPDIDLRIWGYRNVWSRFDISDVNTIIPVSLNSFAVLHNMFDSCFLSQKSASFPSYEIDGTFSELAQKIWVEQHNQLTNILGKEYFYKSNNALLRRAYGAIFMKDMSYEDFLERMNSIKRLLSTKRKLLI